MQQLFMMVPHPICLIAFRGNDVCACENLGRLMAKRLSECGLTSIYWDRTGHKYHGKVCLVACFFFSFFLLYFLLHYHHYGHPNTKIGVFAFSSTKLSSTRSGMEVLHSANQSPRPKLNAECLKCFEREILSFSHKINNRTVGLYGLFSLHWHMFQKSSCLHVGSDSKHH